MSFAKGYASSDKMHIDSAFNESTFFTMEMCEFRSEQKSEKDWTSAGLSAEIFILARFLFIERAR